MTIVYAGAEIDYQSGALSSRLNVAGRRMVYEFVDDPEAEEIAASRSRSDLAILRSEVLATIRQIHSGDVRTVLGALALDGPQSISEVAARTEKLPDEVVHTISVLQRSGITVGSADDEPRYQLHPRGENAHAENRRFVDDPEAEEIAASRSRSDLAVLRSEVLATIRQIHSGDVRTVLGALALDGPQSISEVAARTEKLPDEVVHTISVLQRSGITVGSADDEPRYQLHPRGEAS
jgi:predicted transcriptional regulator